MSAVSIAIMVFVCAVVWGGFFYFASLAARSESRKRAEP